MIHALGYDPGGIGNHGVARLVGDNSAPQDPSGFAEVEAEVVATADHALAWLMDRATAEPTILGVDTMMMWSTKDRLCDKFLRKIPGVKPGSVQRLGSLRGAMLGNGVIVAKRLAIETVEANPKAAIAAGVLSEFEHVWAGIPSSPDHARDALVGAVCAFLWKAGHWQADLFAGEPDPFWPAGVSVYPWPISPEPN